MPEFSDQLLDAVLNTADAIGRFLDVSQSPVKFAIGMALCCIVVPAVIAMPCERRRSTVILRIVAAFAFIFALSMLLLTAVMMRNLSPSFRLSFPSWLRDLFDVDGIAFYKVRGGSSRLDKIVPFAASVTATTAAIATWRGRAAWDAVTWAGLGLLLGLTTTPYLMLVFLLPIVAVSLLLPAPHALPRSKRTFAFDFCCVLATIAYGAAIHASTEEVTTNRSLVIIAPLLVVAAAVVGPAIRSFVSRTANRAMRLRIIWPLCILWLMAPGRSLVVLLLATIGVRLVIYQLRERPLPTRSVPLLLFAPIEAPFDESAP